MKLVQILHKFIDDTTKCLIQKLNKELNKLVTRTFINRIYMISVH